jgi:hypothetical protein
MGYKEYKGALIVGSRAVGAGHMDGPGPAGLAQGLLLGSHVPGRSVSTPGGGDWTHSTRISGRTVWHPTDTLVRCSKSVCLFERTVC